VTRILGALGAEDVVVFVHRLEQNSDPELLQLVEIEMRALLSAGGLPGDATPFEQCTPECRGEPFRPGH
jgi:translation elongation factor EF-Tu-like GTPase